MVSATIRQYPCPPTVAQILPVPSPSHGADDDSVSGRKLLKAGMDSFRSVIDYRRYHLTNLVAYINPDADLSLHKEKCKVYILYPTLEPFSCNYQMALLGFYSTIPEPFDGQRLSEVLTTLGVGSLPRGFRTDRMHQLCLPRHPQSQPPSCHLAAHHPLAAKRVHIGLLAP